MEEGAGKRCSECDQYPNHSEVDSCAEIKTAVAARFVTKVTKRAAMPARFVTNEVVTNRAGITPFLSLGYQYM